MPLWFIPLITLGIKAVAVCACAGAGCYVCNKVVKAVKGGQKLKGLKYKDREAARQAALEANKQNQTKIDDKNKGVKEIDEKTQQRDKEIKKIQNKIRDPNLSEEDRRKLKNELALLLTQQDDDKKERDNITKEIQELEKKIKDNNKVVDSLNKGDVDRQWIWEVLTLENILICLAIYAVWQIVRDEKKH